MSRQSQDQHRARYTMECNLEAVRVVKAGQEASVTAQVLRKPQADAEQLGSAGREGGALANNRCVPSWRA